MNKFQQWLISNELFLKIMLIVILSIISVSFFILSVTLSRSKASYVDSYKQSNQVIMDKIQKDYESLNDNINRIFDLVDSSQVVENYLTTQNKDSQTIIDLIHQMEATRSIFETAPSNLILLGYNEATFVQNSNIKTHSAKELLASPIVNKMENTAASSQYFFVESGPTFSNKDQPGLLFVRKLISDKEVFGYAIIFISEEHFSTIFEDLLDRTLHTVYIVNQDNQIISSNNKNQVGLTFNKNLQIVNEQNITESPLYSYNFTLYNEMNLKHLVANMNLAEPTIFITISAIIFISIGAFFIIRKTTKPIYELIDYLPSVTQKNFKEKIEITGTYEIKKLRIAYNSMLTDLETYFEHVMQAESDKRLSEINALLLQIQPHFIYNTLTAIKFLVWKNENEKAIEGIDNFIHLLRHTINNQEEFTPLFEEIKSIESYSAILKLRYGDQIELTHHISNDCSNALIPRLIIQPIIENAYLHAFPSGKEGIIQIFVRKKENQLLIEIIDNGIGYNTNNIFKNNNKTSLYYSGIGLKNIQERLKLIYQDQAELYVTSISNKGTSVSLSIPFSI